MSHGASDEHRDQVMILAGFVYSPRVKNVPVITQLVSTVIAWTGAREFLEPSTSLRGSPRYTVMFAMTIT